MSSGDFNQDFIWIAAREIEPTSSLRGGEDIDQGSAMIKLVRAKLELRGGDTARGF